MPVFKDSTGREWQIQFDALLLGDVREETGIDLADPTGRGYLQVATDAVSLVRVLAVLLRDALKDSNTTPKQLSRNVCGEAINQAEAAIWGAAENFFPQSRWSVLRSNYQQSKKTAEAMDKMRPVLELLRDEATPDAMRQAMLAYLSDVAESGDSSDSASESTAYNSTDETQSTPATTTPESPESAHAA